MKTSLTKAGILIIILLFSVSTKAQVDATHSASDTLTYQMVYVTHNKSCYNYDIQITNKYNEITTLYLSAYGLQHFYYDSLCITEKEFESYRTPQYTDILIVVYSKSLGREILHENNIGGFFTWVNGDKKDPLRIEVCDCPSFNYGDPVWVLSHELAHFALYYLGFERETFEGWVHYNQNIYYTYCEDGDYRDPHCPPIFAKLQASTYSYSVMNIPEEAYDAKPPQKKFAIESAIEKSKKATEKNKESADKTKQKKSFDYKKETLKKQPTVNSKIDSIKTGVYTAEELLHYVSFKNEKAKKELEKAWTSLWWAKKYLKDAETTQKEGEKFISKLKYKEAYYKYNYSFDQVNKINKYLFEITDYIQKAKSFEK